MRGDKKTIEFLNKALKAELTAINQYFLHSRMLKDWGVSKLAEKEYKESIEEMEHADKIIERILFFYIGETVEEILKCDMKLEDIALPIYRDAVEHCEKVRDYGSRDLLQGILVNEEEHVDFLETQFDLIKQMGIQNYVQMQSESAE